MAGKHSLVFKFLLYSLFDTLLRCRTVNTFSGDVSVPHLTFVRLYDYLYSWIVAPARTALRVRTVLLLYQQYSNFEMTASSIKSCARPKLSTKKSISRSVRRNLRGPPWGMFEHCTSSGRIGHRERIACEARGQNRVMIRWREMRRRSLVETEPRDERGRGRGEEISGC
jgi:hypothetical protein